MPPVAPAAAAANRRLAADVELGAGEADPGDPAGVPEECAVLQRLLVPAEAAGMLMLGFSNAQERPGDPGISFGPGDPGAQGIKALCGGCFAPDQRLQEGRGIGGKGGRLLVGQRLHAADSQQSAEDGGVLLLLGGGEAQGMDEDVKACAGKALGGGKAALPGSLRIAAGLLQRAAGAAGGKAAGARKICAARKVGWVRLNG